MLSVTGCQRVCPLRLQSSVGGLVGYSGKNNCAGHRSRRSLIRLTHALQVCVEVPLRPVVGWV